MAHGSQVSSTVVLLTDIPPLDSKTDPKAVQNELAHYGYAFEFPRIVSASLVEGQQPPVAVCVLHGDQPQNLPPSARMMYKVSPATITMTLNPAVKQVFTVLQAKYRHLVFYETADQISISGPIEIVNRFCQQFQKEASHVLASIPEHQLAAVASPASTPQAEEVYDNLNPDALALLTKLPSGQIVGVRYNCPAGKVFVSNVPPELENERISNFQNAYHNVISKIKMDSVPLPPLASPAAVDEVIKKFDADYDQCVFLRQGEVVRIVSCSSRQFDQAKLLFVRELAESCGDRTVVIEFEKGRTLTLKQADITEEVVDVIVNPANNSLQHAGGVAAALDKASGGSLQVNSSLYMHSHRFVPTGKVAIVKVGGRLHCNAVINAVGPMRSQGPSECERLLQSVVNETLKCAEVKASAKSISFPAISTGIFGVSNELVARVLVDTILGYNFKKPDLTDIRIVIIDYPTFAPFASYFKEKKASMEMEKAGTRKSVTVPARQKLGVSSSPPGPDREKHEEEMKGKDPGVQSIPGLEQGPRLSKDDLNEIYKHLKPVATHWEKLGEKLGLSREEIARVSSQATKPASRLRKILIEWLSQDSRPARVSVLIEALVQLQIKEAAKPLQAIIDAYSGPDQSETEQTPSNNEETADVSRISYPPMKDSGSRDNDPAATDKTPDNSTPPSTATYHLPETTLTGTSQVTQDQSPAMTSPTTPPVSSPPPGQPGGGPTGYNSGQMWGYPINRGQGVQYPFSHDNIQQGGMDTSGSMQQPPGQIPITAQAGYQAPIATQGGYPSPITTPGGYQVPISTPGGYPALTTAQQGYQVPITFSGSGQLSQEQYALLWSRYAASGQQQFMPQGQELMGLQYQTPDHQVANRAIGRGQPYQTTQARECAASFPNTPGVGQGQARPIPMPYSQAAAGRGRGLNSNVVTTQPSTTRQDIRRTDIGSSRDNASSANAPEKETTECPICHCEFTDPVQTKCHHKFCKDCLEEAKKHSSYCPICKVPIMQVVGNQPDGKMQVFRDKHSSVAGYESYGIIQINYDIPSGVQTERHPSPGKRYHGAQRVAYLPDNKEGREVLELLRRAFDARLIFTVGTSITSGRSDMVTWNDIHHKTSTHGGPQNYGYPDPTYLARVKADLAAKGIVPEKNSDSVV